jgi:hypothetical protein
MWKTKDHNVSETGSVSVLRWRGQDKPTQLGPLGRAIVRILQVLQVSSIISPDHVDVTNTLGHHFYSV